MSCPVCALPLMSSIEKVMTAVVTPEHLDRTFGTNARGTYFTVQKALPYLNDRASIILVAAANLPRTPAAVHRRSELLPQWLFDHSSTAAVRSLSRRQEDEKKGRFTFSI